tara:strand:+ start:3532 stop:3957 length:426 start_codon:yes stop_codon:yes gene_type:complete
VTENLTDDHRKNFVKLADILIPEAEGMPSASQMHIQNYPLDQILKLRPELRDDLLRVLNLVCGKDPHSFLEELNESDTAAFDTLSNIASAAYLIQPKVHRLLKYSGQVARPSHDSEENDYFSDGLLQPVIDRGRRYREVPD